MAAGELIGAAEQYGLATIQNRFQRWHDRLTLGGGWFADRGLWNCRQPAIRTECTDGQLISASAGRAFKAAGDCVVGVVTLAL